MSDIPLPFRDAYFLGIYFPGMLIVVLCTVLLAWVIMLVLNYYRLTRFFWHPPIVFASLIVIVCYLLTRILLLR